MAAKTSGKGKSSSTNIKSFKKSNDKINNLKRSNTLNSKLKRKQNKIKLEEINQDFKKNNDKIEDIHHLMKTYDHQKKHNINNDNIIAKTSLPSGDNIQKISEIDLQLKKQRKEMKDKADKELDKQLDFISGFKL